ncbi:MAG: hypothetical protein ED556_11840 [Winogradskyella sp.]|uniref:hypothetical protein n=1 Tax=Winogradskyella sp. TaxID=1883156 RepID=UPI000F3F4DBA|nr:hypothetical protein [Winogradskyella sp.]RNC84144.1 MAG: hypothetical protein ED556_11840 [Winogradskyella sp.]
MNLSKEDILNEIIVGYRQVIDQRYQFQNLKKRYKLPESIDEPIVEDIKYFFLNYIYPDIDNREELNGAFQTLDENIRRPERLLGLLRESVKLIFKHGRHLPKIMMAGLKALKSYRSATQFEATLVKAAIAQKMEPPYSVSKINALIQTLSLKDIEQFIESTESLFMIMYDEVLVQKIQDVIGYLIERMRKNPKLFSEQEISGLEIGLEMIIKGDKVLNDLSEEHKDLLIQFIIQVEKDNLNDLFT